MVRRGWSLPMEQIKKTGRKPLGLEGMDSGEWVLIDLGDVIVHVMLPDTRAFYDLEKLWTTRPDQSRTPEAPQENHS